MVSDLPDFRVPLPGGCWATSQIETGSARIPICFRVARYSPRACGAIHLKVFAPKEGPRRLA